MASKNIKGITIEFDGDTTKLGRALNDINAKAKGVDKELKAINKSLKFNPKNTELIAQKQTLLKQKIAQSKQQLEAFKAAEAAMKADGVDKNSQEFMELRRNIIETESKIKHFNSELQKTRRAKFDQLGKSFKDAGAKMQAVGQGMTKYVTGPIVAGAAASVAAFNEVKNGLNIVTQKTGATGAELKEMQDSARNLAKTIPTDFETAGTAIGEVATRFDVAGKELEDLSGQYVKFAKVNGVDLNNSIDQTQKALSAFGKSAKDAPALLDSLTRAGQKSGASVDTLAAGLIQNASAFKQMGLSMDQSVALMAQVEKSGVNSETVMQGMRKALKNATKEGIPLNDALAKLQKTIKEGKSDTDGLTEAYELFGKSGDQMFNAIKNGSIDFNELTAAAEGSAGALNQVFADTMTPAEQFQTTLNTVKDTGYEVGARLMEMLVPVLEKISAGMQKVSEWWGTLSPETQDMIIKIGLVVAAIGPLLIVIGKITSGIGALIQFLPMIASPAGIAVLAIGGLIAAGVLLYKNWDKVKKKAHDLKEGILKPFRWIRDKIKAIIDKIRGFFDFEFKLPKLKLPHFSIQPPGWRLRDLLEGEIPSLGIDWYAKGGIFTKPTVAGIGEAGPEGVIPLDKLWRYMDRIAEGSGGDQIVVNVYGSPGMDVNALAAAIEQKLTAKQKRRRSAYGYI